MVKARNGTECDQSPFPAVLQLKVRRNVNGGIEFPGYRFSMDENECVHTMQSSFDRTRPTLYHSAQTLLSSRLLSNNLKIRIYKTIILPVVLYGCETWSRTLREEHRLRLFENRVLRRIFRPKRDEVTGERRKLHNEELRDLYASPSIIRIIK
jgi:hypothetical protein